MEKQAKHIARLLPCLTNLYHKAKSRVWGTAASEFGDLLQKMLQNPESEKPRSVAAQGVHAAFDKFLDVQGVTGSSPVSSTIEIP